MVNKTINIKRLGHAQACEERRPDKAIKNPDHNRGYISCGRGRAA
jgi:hypothetical protein